MRVICTTLLVSMLLISFKGFSQEADNAQNEIDEHIWKPFITSYSTLDHEVFNSIHSDDLRRINSREIRTAKPYKEKNTAWFTKAKKDGYKQSIAFNFDKRIVTRDQAFETGYYKVSITKPNGDQSDHYARFHVMLRKENGKWKITQDWDSNILNGERVTAEDFLKAGGMKSPKSTSVSTIDYVKILDNKSAEALHYYENNWKLLRKKATEHGFIKSYQLLKVDNNENYDLLLITEYATQGQYDAKEDNFKKLMENYMKNGVDLLNDIQPNAFRKNVAYDTVKTL